MAKGRTRLTWASLLALSGLAAAIGFAIVNNSTSRTGALVDAFAAGALLTMIADEMAPEPKPAWRSAIGSNPGTTAGASAPSSDTYHRSNGRTTTVTPPKPWPHNNGVRPEGGTPDRHFLSGSDGHGVGSFWTCRGAAVGIAMQRMAPRMAPKRHTVHQRSRDKALSVQGLGGTPGGTRIPNLLIRRWTQTAHSRPQPSIPSGVKRVTVRRRP